MESVKKYVLLDRDGTIIVNKHYQKDPAITELLPNAAAGLRAFRAAGFGLVLLTNQSGIGRGYLTEADLHAVNARMVELLREESGDAGLSFDGMYFCPHVEADNCGCRKPRAGLAERAARELGFSPGDAVVVGDREADIETGAAFRAARTVLVRTGYGAEAAGLCSPDYVAEDLLDAARRITSRAFSDNPR